MLNRVNNFWHVAVQYLRKESTKDAVALRYFASTSTAARKGSLNKKHTKFQRHTVVQTENN